MRVAGILAPVQLSRSQTPDPAAIVTPLAYESPDLAAPLPASVAALRWCRVAAAILALEAMANSIPRDRTQLAQLAASLDPWTLCQLALAIISAALLALCAFLHLRKPPRADSVLRQLFFWTWACMTLVMVVSAAVQIVRWSAWITPASIAWRLPSQFAASLFLLLPPLLLGVTERFAWWRRICLIAGAIALAYGVEGVQTLMHLLREPPAGSFSLPSTWIERLQAQIREPLPFVGLWPLAGLVAGVLFLVVARDPSRRRTLVVATTLMVIYVVLLNWTWMKRTNLWAWRSVQQSASNGLFIASRVIVQALPFWLIAYLLLGDWRRGASEP